VKWKTVKRKKNVLKASRKSRPPPEGTRTRLTSDFSVATLHIKRQWNTLKYEGNKYLNLAFYTSDHIAVQM